ncbi:hypothetical protein MKW98_025111, partial [Papaver atlanticum]
RLKGDLVEDQIFRAEVRVQFRHVPVPGLGMKLDCSNLNLHYAASIHRYSKEIPDAYERLTVVSNLSFAIMALFCASGSNSIHTNLALLEFGSPTKEEGSSSSTPTTTHDHNQLIKVE